jgi:predicted tellurium resistance membrane protein TerC
MDRYPIVIWIGAAVLGRVGAEMISTDPWVVAQFHPPELFSIAAQIAAAAGVMLVGWALRRRAAKRWKKSMRPGV